MKTLDIENNFLAIEDEHSNFDNSEIAILSAPYEYTVSFGEGTNLGPEGIIEASHYVEFYDDEFDRELCFDRGICTLPPLDFSGLQDSEGLTLIYNHVKELLEANKFVVTLGGEHTISQSPIKAHFEKFPEMSILQFDAHSDLREEYEGTPLSHASIMARVKDFFPIDRITQVGIRAQCIEEAKLIKESGINTFYASAIRRGLHGNSWQKKVAETLGDLIYVTFDVDYFDPSIMPSTGTPEPDGFFYSETLEIFREILKQGKQIIGFDVVELAPVNNLSHPDMTAARLVYKILNFAFTAR
jgi:agmatinase